MALYVHVSREGKPSLSDYLLGGYEGLGGLCTLLEKGKVHVNLGAPKILATDEVGYSIVAFKNLNLDHEKEDESEEEITELQELVYNGLEVKVHFLREDDKNMCCQLPDAHGTWSFASNAISISSQKSPQEEDEQGCLRRYFVFWETLHWQKRSELDFRIPSGCISSLRLVSWKEEPLL